MNNNEPINQIAGPIYGGFKLIRAIRMTAAQAVAAGFKTGDRQPDELGYQVTYEDAYTSWSPEAPFEKAYDRLGAGDGADPDAKFPILRFFAFSHLPDRLQEVSAPFAALAWRTARRSKPEHAAETATALRKLLEAKDAAVRAAL